MKVYETLYKIWSTVLSSLAHMEVYDYEVYACRDVLNNLGLRIHMCHLIGYRNNIFGKLFNKPFENKVCVAQNFSLLRVGADI